VKGERPQFASSYGISGDTNGTIGWEVSSGKMAAARNYWVATADLHGNPHSSPIWGVWMDDRLYFGMDTTSRKARNVAANSRAVIHLESGDDVVLLHCDVATEDDPAVKERVFHTYREKYSMPDNFSFEPVMCAIPYRGFAWLEADFPGTATRYSH
jgi:uncharacterized pyridoxamine 5'-phosphate oxidase family protein